MGRRTLLLIAALVVAALGTVAVWLYAQNADQRAAEGQAQVTVLVAKTRIDVSTTGAAANANGAFEQQTIAASAVTPGALSDITPIANLVAIVPIFPGQQIISSQWGTAAGNNGLAIPAGKLALQFTLSDPARVAGFVTPGSKVVIFLNITDINTKQPKTQTLLVDVPVIAVGSTTSAPQQQAGGTAATGTNTTEQVPTANLTLGLSQVDAQRLLFAVNGGAGTIWFGLEGTDSKPIPNLPPATAQSLFR